jgi:hypothetical protein
MSAATLYVTRDLGAVGLALEYAGGRASIETQRIAPTSRNLLVQYVSNGGPASFYMHGWLRPSGDVAWAGARRRDASAPTASEVAVDEVLDEDGALIDWLLEQYFAGLGDRPGTYVVRDPPRIRNPRRGRSAARRQGPR